MKWKPSKSQRRAFAEKMQDPEFREAYYARREKRAERRRASSKFDYENAGGMYMPTRVQFDAALILATSSAATPEQREAANVVVSGYSFGRKVHHDYIHVVNEYIRGNSSYKS